MWNLLLNESQERRRRATIYVFSKPNLVRYFTVPILDLRNHSDKARIEHCHRYVDIAG